METWSKTTVWENGVKTMETLSKTLRRTIEQNHGKKRVKPWKNGIKQWKNRVKPWKNLVKQWKHGVKRWENRGKCKGGPHCVSKKQADFRYQKWTLWNNKVLLREQQTDQQMWKHFPVHCQILKRANVQLFQRRKQNLWISYSHFKSCTVALWFFTIYFLVAKTEKLTNLLLY